MFAVCANKIDMSSSRAVNESEGRLWAESKGFLYFETSAQNGDGIQELFQVNSLFLSMRKLWLLSYSNILFTSYPNHLPSSSGVKIVLLKRSSEGKFFGECLGARHCEIPYSQSLFSSRDPCAVKRLGAGEKFAVKSLGGGEYFVANA